MRMAVRHWCHVRRSSDERWLAAHASGQMGQQNGGKNDNVLSGTDAAAWSQALLATLVAAPQQGPPPSNNEDFNLLQALLAASQTQNAGQTSSNNSDSAAALLLASQLQRPASNVGALSPTQEHAGPSATLYGNSPNINRPRKSKKFRYSAVLKQIRQAEVCCVPRVAIMILHLVSLHRLMATQSASTDLGWLRRCPSSLARSRNQPSSSRRPRGTRVGMPSASSSLWRCRRSCRTTDWRWIPCARRSRRCSQPEKTPPRRRARGSSV